MHNIYINIYKTRLCNKDFYLQNQYVQKQGQCVPCIYIRFHHFILSANSISNWFVVGVPMSIKELSFLQFHVELAFAYFRSLYINRVFLIDYYMVWIFSYFYGIQNFVQPENMFSFCSPSWIHEKHVKNDLNNFCRRIWKNKTLAIWIA